MSDHSSNEMPPRAEDLTGLCCPKCDYDLTGLVSKDCPECGHTLCIADIRQATKRSNKPLEVIARTTLITNVLLLSSLILLLVLEFLHLGRNTSVAAYIIVVGLLACGMVSLLTLVVAIMDENDRSTFHSALSILLSFIAVCVCAMLR